MSTKKRNGFALSLLIALFAVVFIGFAIWRTHYYYVVIPRELQEVKTELATLKKKLEELENDPFVRSSREQAAAIEALRGGLKGVVKEEQLKAAGLGTPRPTPIVTEEELKHQRQKKKDE